MPAAAWLNSAAATAVVGTWSRSLAVSVCPQPRLFFPGRKALGCACRPVGACLAGHTASQCPARRTAHVASVARARWKQHREREVGGMKRAYSPSGSSLRTLLLGGLDKTWSRTETLDAVCACDLLIQITSLLLHLLGIFLNLFYFISSQESRFLLRHSITTVTC